MPRMRVMSEVALPIDGGRVPVKLLFSMMICWMAGCLESSSKAAHGYQGHE